MKYMTKVLAAWLQFDKSKLEGLVFFLRIATCALYGMLTAHADPQRTCAILTLQLGFAWLLWLALRLRQKLVLFGIHLIWRGRQYLLSLPG
jgi:hypothetical protein